MNSIPRWRVGLKWLTIEIVIFTMEYTFIHKASTPKWPLVCVTLTRRREERQLLAAKRREDREREMREMRLDMIQRSVEKSIKPNQSYAMRVREGRRELR